MSLSLAVWHHGGGNLAGTDTGRAHLSHTSLTTFLACPQKFDFSYEQRLEPIRRAQPLTLGKAYQLSIEHGDPEVGVEQLREEATILSQGDEDRVLENQAIVRGASRLYLHRFGAGSGTKELEYLVRLRNPATRYLSRTFDLLGYADEWQSMGSHAVLIENKLVGQLQAASIRKLPLDRQLALECYGTWRATGQEVREVRYRYMRKPSIKQRKGEHIEEFCDRIISDYEERPDFYVHEEHMLRTADDLVRTEAELWEWASQLRRQRANAIWPRNSSHCTDYGGCAFMSLCLREPGADGLYRVRDRAPARVTAQ